LLGEWIKGIFVSIWTWFSNLILSIGKTIIKSIQDMVQDILTDFSTAGELTLECIWSGFILYNQSLASTHVC
jgi:hypothetical protein